MTQLTSNCVRVVDSAEGCPEIPIIVGRGNAKVIMWPGNDARHRTLQLMTLEDGACTIPLKHDSDAVYYLIQGEGVVTDLTSGEVSPLVEGAMVHVDAGDRYRFAANDGRTVTILGGPCPADESLYASLTVTEAK